MTSNFDELEEVNEVEQDAIEVLGEELEDVIERTSETEESFKTERNIFDILKNVPDIVAKKYTSEGAVEVSISVALISGFVLLAGKILKS